MSQSGVKLPLWILIVLAAGILAGIGIAFYLKKRTDRIRNRGGNQETLSHDTSVRQVTATTEMTMDAERDTTRQMDHGQRDLTVDAGKQALIREYLRLRQTVRLTEADEVYRKAFLRYHRIYQILSALAREMEKETMSGAEYIQEINICFSNLSLRGRLDEHGFIIPGTGQNEREGREQGQMTDRVTVAGRRNQASCRSGEDSHETEQELMNMDILTLKSEMDMQNRLLQDLRGVILAKEILTSTGVELYHLMICAGKEETESCLRLTDSIMNTLRQLNVVPLFAYHPCVRESETIRLYFEDVSADALELPALCLIQDDEYLLLGGCIGTRRIRG